jgi:hypothetical protein
MGFRGERKSIAVVGPIGCGRNECLGFLVSCGESFGFMGSFRIWGVFCWVPPRELWCEFAGKNVVSAGAMRWIGGLSYVRF